MGKIRTKLAVKEAPSLVAARQAMKDAARLASSIKATQASLELKLQALKDKYAVKLDNMNDKHKASVKVLHDWAQCNQQEFVNKKSVQWPSGTFGYRTNPHAVKARGVTLTKAQELIKAQGLGYINVKETIDKQGIIKDRANKKAMAKLNTIGLWVEQEEVFFVETETQSESK